MATVSARHRHAKERAAFWRWALPNLGECLRWAGALAEAARRESAARKDLDVALVRLHRRMVFDVRDWSSNATDAALYALVAGWGEAMPDVSRRFGWSTKTVYDLERLHRAMHRAIESNKGAMLEPE